MKLKQFLTPATATWVAPLAGAWIETEESNKRDFGAEVAPLAGAWIETIECFNHARFCCVAPLAGAWIETRLLRLMSKN